MKSKNVLKSLDLIMLSMLMVAFSVFSISCEKDNEDSPAIPTTNHTITIQSSTYGMPLQFTSLILTPVDSSSASVTYNFVLNPGTSISVEATLPKTAAYKIEIVSPTGTIVTWNSVVLDSVNGTTSINLSSWCSSINYCPNSRCNGILPDSC